MKTEPNPPNSEWVYVNYNNLISNVIEYIQIGTWNYLPLHGENKIAMPVLSLRKKLESIL